MVASIISKSIARLVSAIHIASTTIDRVNTLEGTTSFLGILGTGDSEGGVG
jgi:hypothetical protein